MMMNLCILSLLIEDVVAMGGGQGDSVEVLLGKAKKEVAPAPEEEEEVGSGPKHKEEVEIAPKATKAPAPEEEEAAQGVSCGGHDAASCGECITAKGAPEGLSAASWCNGDCVLALDGDQISCVAYVNGYVSCGHHQAENCESCTNKAVGEARFCNGNCEFKGNNNMCELREDL